MWLTNGHQREWLWILLLCPTSTSAKPFSKTIEISQQRKRMRDGRSSHVIVDSSISLKAPNVTWIWFDFLIDTTEKYKKNLFKFSVRYQKKHEKWPFYKIMQSFCHQRFRMSIHLLLCLFSSLSSNAPFNCQHLLF